MRPKIQVKKRPGPKPKEGVDRHPCGKIERPPTPEMLAEAAAKKAKTEADREARMALAAELDRVEREAKSAALAKKLETIWRSIPRETTGAREAKRCEALRLKPEIDTVALAIEKGLIPGPATWSDHRRTWDLRAFWPPAAPYERPKWDHEAFCRALDYAHLFDPYANLRRNPRYAHLLPPTKRPPEAPADRYDPEVAAKEADIDWHCEEPAAYGHILENLKGELLE